MDDRLRLAFVATQLGVEHGGLARYASELLAALARREDLAVIPVVQKGHRRLVRDIAEGRLAGVLEIPAVPGSLRAAWEVMRLGAALRPFRPDVIHCTRNVAPRRPPVPVVLTVHDVMSVTWPQQFPALKRWLLPRQFMAAVRRAELIVCVSRATLDKLAELDPRVRVRATVVREAIPGSFRSIVPSAPPALVDQRFALVVGDLSPRKNLKLLFEVWPEVFEKSGGMKIVVIGPDGWESKDTQAMLAGLVTSGMAIRLDRVSDEELSWAYRNAEMVLLPSREEGFCLPLAEALSVGAKVVASSDPAMVETAGGAALHLPTMDESAWRDAAVQGAALSIPSGSPNVAASWDDVASEMAESYYRVARNEKVGRLS